MIRYTRQEVADDMGPQICYRVDLVRRDARPQAIAMVKRARWSGPYPQWDVFWLHQAHASMSVNTLAEAKALVEAEVVSSVTRSLYQQYHP